VVLGSLISRQVNAFGGERDNGVGGVGTISGKISLQLLRRDRRETNKRGRKEGPERPNSRPITSEKLQDTTQKWEGELKLSLLTGGSEKKRSPLARFDNGERGGASGGRK